MVRRFVKQNGGRKNIVPPVKMTRSVGLQIQMPGSHSHGLQHLSSPRKNVERSLPSTVTITTKPQAIAGASNMAVGYSSSSSSGNSSSSSLTSQNGNHRYVQAQTNANPATSQTVTDIASYVPQQTQPRYRQIRKSEDPGTVALSSTTNKISPYGNTASSSSHNNNTTKSITQRAHEHSQQFIHKLGLPMNSIHITPVHHHLSAPPPQPSNNPQQHRQTVTANGNTVKAMLARVRSSTVDSIGPSQASQNHHQSVQQQQQSNWHNKPGPRPGTTVNKVTLPGRLPNVIDLTDEDLEKERAAAAAAGRISAIRANPMRSP